MSKARDIADLDFNSPDIDGGNIDGAVIGGTTAAAVSGTTGQFSTSLNVDGTATVDGLTVGGNNSYTSNIKFDYGASAPTYFANWGYKASSDGNKVFLTITDAGTAKDVLVANYNGNVGIGINPSKKLTVFGTGVGNATVQIEGEGGADPYINFLTNNAQHWSLGVDDSDGDKFKLSEHSALGTNDYLTVDTVGNLMVGKSSTGLGNQGAELSATGQLKGTASNQVVAYLNRTTSDGTILEFRKDTTAVVGSIGSVAGARAYFATNNVGISPYNNVIYPTNATGATTNGSADLGASSARFKDLYLSGGVVFGPASASNVSSQTLDSYEEGGFSPAIVGGTQTITVIQQARYTKIGRSVTLNVYCTQSTVTDGTALKISGLPFTATSYNATGIVNFSSNGSGSTVLCRTVPNASHLMFYRSNANQVSITQTQNAGHIIFSVTYITDQ